MLIVSADASVRTDTVETEPINTAMGSQCTFVDVCVAGGAAVPTSCAITGE
jgi:hypothetical protein